MAFVKNIEPNSVDSHQTSPAYVLTFTRWRNRDTKNYKEKSTTTRKPLVVVNDAVSVTIKCDKSTPNTTFSCTLKQGDLNYLTAVHPGDYVIANLVNWKSKAMEIRTRALKPSPINKIDDGFKGLFKIQDVNMVLNVAPNGSKQYYVQITARGFDEFNNILYFNPAMATGDAATKILLLNNFKNWTDLIKNKNTNNIQDLLKEVVKRTIGEGFDRLVPKKDLKLNQIPSYIVPEQVSTLLNKKTSYIADINNYYLGIWEPTKSGGFFSTPSSVILSQSSLGFNSYKGFSSFFSTDEGGNYFKTTSEMPGSKTIDISDFQSVNVWSLLSDYANSNINELYTCYRVGVDGKYVYPSFIARQKPFNTEHYEKSAGDKDVTKNTKFLNLPRWKISPFLITSLNIGRSDKGRVNFCQIFTRSLSMDKNFNQSMQISEGNFVEDEEDIKRNGRKPYIASCNYDYAGAETEFRAAKWAKLVADWLFGGHLKMTGTMQTVGIEEPICIGDNLEFDNIVYHIESTTHTMTIDGNGFNTFRTAISLSMGVSRDSNKEIPVYAEMDYTDTLTRRQDDHREGNEKVLPGFSDAQDLPSRTLGEETTETREATFTNPKSRLTKKLNK